MAKRYHIRFIIDFEVDAENKNEAFDCCTEELIAIVNDDETDMNEVFDIRVIEDKTQKIGDWDENRDLFDEAKIAEGDIVQRYLLSLSDCGHCKDWKIEHAKDIKSGKVIVLDINKKGKGLEIAKELKVDYAPTYVVEIKPAAMKKYGSKSRYLEIEMD